MGKGDKKTRRGKIVNKTFGVRRKTKRNQRKAKRIVASSE
ncbi:MAG: 30S ribosomal protein THX [Flavobacteriaceae bacterium]